MLVIDKDKINDFLKELSEKFEIFNVENEVLPFKKYFFSPLQEIFSMDKKNKIVSASAPKKFIVFGLNFQDLEALTQLNEIMKTPKEDYFYFQNIRQSIVIGLIDEELDVVPGGDIVFQNINEKEYRVWTNSLKGKNLIKDNKKFFKEEKDLNKKVSQVPQNKSLGEWEKSMRNLLMDPETLADAIEWSYGHKIWDDLAEKCLGCGICTYVCPLCHCFSIEDRIGLDDKCSRCRNWTACTLPEFSKIAGGHTFRPTIKERYYNWFYHKFSRAYREYGKSQCVGCERCKKFCPAGIDIQEVLNIILEDYNKAKK